MVGSPCCPRDSQESSPTLQFKASVLRCSAFFIAQLSHPYMTTGKTIALTRQTFLGKVMSLLFNMLSRLVIAFLPKSKHLLISWLWSPYAVILESPQNKVTLSIVSPSICHEVMGPDAMILVFWMLSFKPTFSPPLSLSYSNIFYYCRATWFCAFFSNAKQSNMKWHHSNLCLLFKNKVRKTDNLSRKSKVLNVPDPEATLLSFQFYSPTLY